MERGDLAQEVLKCSEGKDAEAKPEGGVRHLNNKILKELNSFLEIQSMSDLRNSVSGMKKRVPAQKTGYLSFTKDLDQILETRTVERAHYYLKRLIKALGSDESGKNSEINMNRWKDYPDILTDSLWMFPRREKSGQHHAGYWGNYIPQIPNQFLRRFTKKGEWILDAFLGSGTTLIECRRLGRNGIGIEIQKKIADETREWIGEEKNRFETVSDVVCADSATADIEGILKERGQKGYQFLFLHPPYWDIIRFSEDPNDLSNAENLDAFLKMLGKILDNTLPYLDPGRHLALVIGDKYAGGEWVPLGFLSMQEVLKRGVKLKSIIVKNFEDTKGKQTQKELWRYRALKGGFYVFKHEYIFLFQKD